MECRGNGRRAPHKKRIQLEKMRRAMTQSSLLDRDETESSSTRTLNQQQQQHQRHHNDSHTTRSQKSSIITSSLVYWIISFACGYCVGAYNGNIFNKTLHKAVIIIDSTTVQERKTSQVIHLHNVPLKSTSHVDNDAQEGHHHHHRPIIITKQQLVEPFVLVNNLAGISVTNLLPGQSVTRHSHKSMHEFFYILDGQGLVQLETETTTSRRSIPNNNNNSIDDEDNNISSSWLSVSKGSLVYAAEREAHAFHVPENASQPMQMIYFGLTTNHP